MRLFIHIPRSGGMTIRNSRALEGRIFAADRKTHRKGHAAAVLKQMRSTGDHHGFEHARWRDIDPKITANTRCFAVIRNPWSRVASRYLFAKASMERGAQYAPKGYADVSSFEAFLEERHKWGDVPYMWHRAIRGWYPAIDHVTSEDGELMCDMLRFEHLDADLKAYFRIPKMTGRRNVGTYSTPYGKLYTDETREIVADWYAGDIGFFGFDFDSTATRNIHHASVIA